MLAPPDVCVSSSRECDSVLYCLVYSLSISTTVWLVVVFIVVGVLCILVSLLITNIIQLSYHHMGRVYTVCYMPQWCGWARAQGTVLRAGERPDFWHLLWLTVWVVVLLRIIQQIVLLSLLVLWLLSSLVSWRCTCRSAPDIHACVVAHTCILYTFVVSDASFVYRASNPVDPQASTFALSEDGWQPPIGIVNNMMLIIHCIIR